MTKNNPARRAGVTTNNDPRRIMTGGSLFYVEKWPPVIILRRKMTPIRRIMSPTRRINTRGVIIQRVGYRKMTTIEKWPPPPILFRRQRSRAPLRDHLAGRLSVRLPVSPDFHIWHVCSWWQDLSDGNIYFEHVTLTVTSDLHLENFNSAHNFITIWRRAFILGRCVRYDKTFPMIP